MTNVRGVDGWGHDQYSGEGWRELKVGAVFDVETFWNATRTRNSGMKWPMLSTCITQITLGSKEGFTPDL